MANALENMLGNVVGEDGVKTDITISIEKSSLMLTSLYLIGTGIIISTSFFVIRGIANNMEHIKK